MPRFSNRERRCGLLRRPKPPAWGCAAWVGMDAYPAKDRFSAKSAGARVPSGLIGPILEGAPATEHSIAESRLRMRVILV